MLQCEAIISLSCCKHITLLWCAGEAASWHRLNRPIRNAGSLVQKQFEVLCAFMEICLWHSLLLRFFIRLQITKISPEYFLGPVFSNSVLILWALGLSFQVSCSVMLQLTFSFTIWCHLVFYPAHTPNILLCPAVVVLSPSCFWVICY